MDGCAHARLLKADRQPFSGPTWLPETPGRLACIGAAVRVQCSFPFARGQEPLPSSPANCSCCKLKAEGNRPWGGSIAEAESPAGTEASPTL